MISPSNYVSEPFKRDRLNITSQAHVAKIQKMQTKQTKLSTAIGVQRQTRYKSTAEERDTPLGVTQ
jgi:hypothetical protein